MKKSILKITGLFAFAALTLYNVQFFNPVNGSGISLAALGNVAVAQSEDEDDDYDNPFRDDDDDTPWWETCMDLWTQMCDDYNITGNQEIVGWEEGCNGECYPIYDDCNGDPALC